jgi:replication factor A1
MATQHSIKSLAANQDRKIEPFTVQVIEIKKMQGDNMLLIISDTNNYIEALLNPVYHSLVDQNQLKENQLILIEDYTVTSNVGRLVVNILNLQLKGICSRLGSPVLIKSPVKMAEEEYTPISALSTFLYDWTIRAKVITKSNLRDFQVEKTGKQGKCMSLMLMDGSGTRISAGFFSEAAEKYSQVIEEGKIYLFSNGIVKLAQPKYRTPESNYQLSFDNKAKIELLPEQNWSISNSDRPFTLISEISSKPEKSIVNICGIIMEIGPVLQKISRTGEALQQRILKIIDQSLTSIDLSLWNEIANSPNINTLEIKKTAILGLGLIVSHFNNDISLTTNKNCSQVLFDPDQPAISELKTWFIENNNPELQIKNLSERKSTQTAEISLKTISEIKENSHSPNEKYLVIGHIRNIKTEDIQFTYESCVSCKKKVVIDSSGFYQCNSCRNSSQECVYRFLFRSIMIADFTGMLFATAFSEVGEFLLKMKPRDFSLKSDQEKKEIIQKTFLSTYMFTIRVTLSNNQDGNTRTEYTIINIAYINYPEATKKVLNIIKYNI